MKKTYKGQYFTIYCDDEFDRIIGELIPYLDTRISKVMDSLAIFNISKFNIYLYNDKEEFRKVSKYPYKLDNMGGTFYLYGVKIYANLNNIKKEELFTAIMHEIIHLLYLNYVEEKGMQNRVIWFEEGLSQNLSGEKDYLLEDANLSEYLERNIYNEEKEIPKIEYLCRHGNKYGEFVDGDTNKYNGYVWSYLMVRYLLDIMPRQYFHMIMRSKMEIDVIGKRIIDSTYNYYKKKVKTRR